MVRGTYVDRMGTKTTSLICIQRGKARVPLVCQLQTDTTRRLRSIRNLCVQTRMVPNNPSAHEVKVEEQGRTLQHTSRSPCMQKACKTTVTASKNTVTASKQQNAASQAANNTTGRSLGTGRTRLASSCILSAGGSLNEKRSTFRPVASKSLEKCRYRKYLPVSVWYACTTSRAAQCHLQVPRVRPPSSPGA